MRIKRNSLWKNEDVRENIDRLRKASGPINEAIISHCDYGNKERGLIPFLAKEFGYINIELEDTDKEIINDYFEKAGGINYYSIKAYILKSFDALFPGKITFGDVLESRFPIKQSNCDIFPIDGKSKNITVEVSVCSKAGYEFLESLLMSPTLGDQFKKDYGIILEKIYVDEVPMTGDILDLLKEATKKLEKFQNESGVKIC